jgi:SARP family transcriptional regulator, regulator of embCAB operon
MPYLVVLVPGHEPRRVTLASPFHVGRTPPNDLVLNDVRVSRHHLRYEKTERGWEVSDDRSTSGMFMNDCRVISPHLLADGDTIQIADILLTFRLD